MHAWNDSDKQYLRLAYHEIETLFILLSFHFSMKMLVSLSVLLYFVFSYVRSDFLIVKWKRINAAFDGNSFFLLSMSFVCVHKYLWKQWCFCHVKHQIMNLDGQKSDPNSRWEYDKNINKQTKESLQ